MSRPGRVAYRAARCRRSGRHRRAGRHVQAAQCTIHQIRLHQWQGHVAPAYAFAQQGVFRPQIRQPPCARAENGKVPPGGEAGAIRQHELHMVASCACGDLRHAAQGMVRRGDRRHHHGTRRHPLQLPYANRQMPGDADGGFSIQHHGGHRAQRLHMQAQRDRGAGQRETAQHPCQPFRRQHHIHGQINLRLHAIQKTLHPRAQAIHALCHRAGFRQHGPAGGGEAGLAGAFPLEQGQAELKFQIRDAIADDGNRPVQAPGRAGKAASLHNRQENAKLLETGRAGRIHLFNFPEQNG